MMLPQDRASHARENETWIPVCGSRTYEKDCAQSGAQYTTVKGLQSLAVLKILIAVHAGLNAAQTSVAKNDYTFMVNSGS